MVGTDMAGGMEILARSMGIDMGAVQAAIVEVQKQLPEFLASVQRTDTRVQNIERSLLRIEIKLDELSNTFSVLSEEDSENG
jgi:septal ring factor EnvC (AmiA/AmiB activator)